jgi:membrane protein implicated in regulation of membrane protease activity
VSRVSTVFWAWTATAILLALGEAVTGDLLVMPWAIGAAMAALLEALHAGTNWQWIAFVAVSSVLLVLAQRLIIRRRK